jgi:ATP-dependent Clp protease ATP-binding subunit ClpA
MLERFTRTARHVVTGAQQEARDIGHRWIGTKHLLLAVVRHQHAPGAATLLRLGITPQSCRAAIARVVGTDEGPLGAGDAEALKAFGIDLDEVRRRAEGAFGKGALDAAPADPGARRAGRGLFGWRRGASGAQTGTGAGEGAGAGRGAAAGGGHIRFTPRAKKSLELALREAVARGDRHIGVEHLVLALLRGDDRVSLAVFERLGVAPRNVREIVLADLREAA